MTVTVGMLCVLSSFRLVGARPFELSRFDFALSVIHGILVQLFTTVVIESKSRLAHERATPVTWTVRVTLMMVIGGGGRLRRTGRRRRH